MTLITSPEALEREFPELAKPPVLEYLRRGGHILVEGGRIKYPTKEVIQRRITEIEEAIEKLRKEIEGLKKLRKSGLSFLRLEFWRHTLRKLRDKEYRNAAELAGITGTLAVSPEGRKILKAFLENEEYRKAVLSANSGSSKRFGERVLEREKEKERKIQERIRRLEERIRKLEEEKKIFRALLKMI